MTNNFSDSGDPISQLVDAFQRMQVPPGPSINETIEFVERATRDRESNSQHSRRATDSKPRRFKFRNLSVTQRLAVGTIGLSTVVGLTLVLLALNSAAPLSAMERMVQRLREVTSYSFRLSTRNTFVREGNTRPTTVNRTGMTYWLAPGSVSLEEQIVQIEEPAPGEQKIETLAHYSEVYPAGKPGIFIDHLAKTFAWLPEMQSKDIPVYSAINQLRMVREEKGEVIRDLGTKAIQGKTARGYMMSIKNPAPPSALDVLEVWIDPDTDLPLEFTNTLKNDTGPEFFRVTDCRWNIALDPKLFEQAPPPGYVDTTPPRSEKELAQIAEALALYADLSGGHYPRVAKFDAEAIRDEMLKLAGFTGPPQAQWTQDKKFRQIQQATVGLGLIARTLRNKYSVGYEGLKVGPHDKLKVLLWWNAWDPKGYRVFYGDLRTEILTEAEGAERGLGETK